MGCETAPVLGLSNEEWVERRDGMPIRESIGAGIPRQAVSIGLEVGQKVGRGQPNGGNILSPQTPSAPGEGSLWRKNVREEVACLLADVLAYFFADVDSRRTSGRGHPRV